MTRSKSFAGVVAGMAALAFGGCSQDGDGNGVFQASPTNRPPVVQSFTISPEVVPAGGTATITIEVSDPDGDTVACSFASTSGQLTRLEGTACGATYKNNMDRDGIDHLTVVISDSNCAPSTISHEIAVGPALVSTSPDNPSRPQRDRPSPDDTPDPGPVPNPGPLPSPTPAPTPKPNLVPKITGDTNLDLVPLGLGTLDFNVEDDDLNGARCEFRVNAQGSSPLAVHAVTCGPLFSVRLQGLLTAPLGEDCVFKVTDREGASAEHHVRVRVGSSLLP